MSYDAPFAGLKVVDLSQGIAGPYCAMLLAQHGAEVIKVEGIGEGDWARTLGVHYGSHSAFSIIGNMGKRSLSVDLKSEAGKQVGFVFDDKKSHGMVWCPGFPAARPGW